MLSPPRGIIYPYIVIYAAVLHLIWAALILIGVSSTHATPVAEITRIFPATWPIVIALLSSSTFAVWGISRRYHNVTVFITLLPQLFLLALGAIGSILAIKNGYYADGVIRPRVFIAADQAPPIVACAMYAFAITRLWPR